MGAGLVLILVAVAATVLYRRHRQRSKVRAAVKAGAGGRLRDLPVAGGMFSNPVYAVRQGEGETLTPAAAGHSWTPATGSEENAVYAARIEAGPTDVDANVVYGTSYARNHETQV